MGVSYLLALDYANEKVTQDCVKHLVTLYIPSTLAGFVNRATIEMLNASLAYGEPVVAANPNLTLEVNMSSPNDAVMVSQSQPDVTRSQSLRQFADWLERLERDEPELAGWISISLSAWVYEPGQIITMARRLAPCNKRFGESWMELSKWFGSIRFEANINRDQVCVKRVVGTREVEVPEQPYKAATTKTEEIVEWDCGALLANEMAQAPPIPGATVIDASGLRP